MLVIDRINNVSLSNGIVRVSVSTLGSDGQSHEAGDVAIPANQFGNVLRALQNAGQQLRARLEEQQAEGVETAEGGDSAGTQ